MLYAMPQVSGASGDYWTLFGLCCILLYAVVLSYLFATYWHYRYQKTGKGRRWPFFVGGAISLVTLCFLVLLILQMFAKASSSWGA
jgi:hypothetical protein